MAGFKVIFEMPDSEDFSLSWSIINRPLCHRWLEKLAYVSANKTIDDPKRFYGMHNASDRYEFMIQGMQELKTFGIDLMDYAGKFETVTHQQLNDIHDAFVKTHGRDWEVRSQNLPPHLVNSWNKVHINLHALESLLSGNAEKSRINVTWRQQGECMDTYCLYDYDHFTYDSEFGDVFINYREVGKSPWEIWKNQDKLALDRCVPSRHWCADLRIVFYDQTILPENVNAFQNWYDENFDWFRDNFGFSYRDKRIGVGFYPVAKLENCAEPQVILHQITKSNGIKEILVY